MDTDNRQMKKQIDLLHAEIRALKEASSVSLDVFCLVILLFFLFGLAVGASEEEYDYPRKVPEPWFYTRTVTVDWEEEDE